VYGRRAGYSRLIGDEETATVHTLTEYRKIFIDPIAPHQGHVADTAGDNLFSPRPVVNNLAFAQFQGTTAMEIDINELAEIERYKLLIGLVFPRPIALISTRSENGVANCAPFSYFNAMCEDPMLIIASFNARTDGKMKHSLANILRTNEFVVNLVDESIANGMHISSIEYPEEVSEFDQAGFTPATCKFVQHPRIAEAPASFECRLFRRIDVGPARDLILGEVLHIHIRDGLVDPKTKRVSEANYRPVGRLYGVRYCTTRQRFDLPGELPPD
jgi:flavin reductase (DIM6/NTAB) family NADH-FMN oxidoreductase RutF